MITYPNQHDLCGEIGYDALWMGEYIGSGDSPLAYDKALKEFTFESNDNSLVGV